MAEPIAFQPSAPVDWQSLASICRQVRFEPGQVVRQSGLHYPDMYLLTDGSCDVLLDASAASITRRAGSPIGEIAFLRGWPAIATVTARTVVHALVIDDAMLAHLDREHPAMAAQLLRHLAQVAEERTSANVAFAAGVADAGAGAIEVHLCRTPDMLERAQRLRYEVYCQELGRASPYADHARRIISDHLDATGHTFIALQAGDTIGTLRANIAAEGPLGALEELYGMRASPQHPSATGVCTKLIVKQSSRGGPAAMKLIGATVRFGTTRGIQECYIDAIPALLPYYRALGFKLVGPAFFHRENGPSYPMMLDLVKYGRQWRQDPSRLQQLQIYIKAHLLKGFDRLMKRGPAAHDKDTA